MSWHYSRELVAEYWGERSLDGEPCAPLRSTDIAGMYWSPDKTTDVSNRSQSGMTYEPLTDEVGEDVLTWCQEGSLVRTLVLQEKEQDLTENNPVFGPRCGGLLARLDPDTCSLKTPQCLLFEEGQESLQTLPSWGSMRDGELWEHTIPALLTEGTGCGSWPTPAARDYKGSNSREHCAVNGTGRKHMDQLPNAVAYPDLYFGPEKQEQTGGQLNPDWVEWLMGWPIGWTDLKQSETDRCQLVQH